MVQDSCELFLSRAGGGFRLRFPFAKRTTFPGRAERYVFQDCETRLFATPENDAQAAQRGLALGAFGAGIPPNGYLSPGARRNCNARTICSTHANPVSKFVQCLKKFLTL